MNTRSFVATSAAAILGFAAVFGLGLTAIRDAGAGSPKIVSPCDKDGPFPRKSTRISVARIW